MSQDIKIVYQSGAVSGGYAFSANSTTITMGGYVENQPKEIREVLEHEAIQARQNYIDMVAQKKANGEKVNPLTVKREAVAKAIEDTKSKFGEEAYNEAKKVSEANKAGRQAVSGSRSKKKAEKAPKAKAKKAATPAPDDVDTFDDEIPDAPTEEFETPADTTPASADNDPFSEDDF